MATAEPSSTRRPYRGSCHCGHTKYIAYLSFPPVTTPNSIPSSIRIYKCNCSTCHKMGFFHVRLKDSPKDFMLLSPVDLETGGLGDYQCNTKRIHWYFCKNCGVRCFAFNGTGETAEVEGADGKMMTVWRPEKEGWKEFEEGRNSYLSVNAATLDPGQEGFDLREWTENEWIWYLDCKDDKEEDRFGEPHDGGCY